jgi:hypothetical protein
MAREDPEYTPFRDPRYTNPARPIGPNPMHRRFERKPRRWRLAFWRRAR